MGTNKDREARAARERARLYQARQDFHASQRRRRNRETVIASLASGLIVLAAVGAQIAYFTAGPGAAAPAETSSPAPEQTPVASGSSAPVD